jgi:hypothetical protein
LGAIPQLIGVLLIAHADGLKRLLSYEGVTPIVSNKRFSRLSNFAPRILHVRRPLRSVVLAARPITHQQRRNNGWSRYAETARHASKPFG